MAGARWRTAAALALGAAAGVLAATDARAGGALGIEWASTAQAAAEEGVAAGGWMVVLGFVVLGLIVAFGITGLLTSMFSFIAGGSIAAGALVLGGLLGAGAAGGSVLDTDYAVPPPAVAARAPAPAG